ncbi:acyl-CoA dehydrogenase family protein [Actinomadura rupiterrae]|uniref:acyl-CoA dehydrogenase family protein n=1 Tax=Actinomadura rupiterrae TaxID=559627 RepID=UPI0020A29A9B|nr:acyl-CoA dehydrogenase family protein [Actinomadura rupiterrae]MCP2336097.1 alkylation response protein AidB-like acyl-CoA dehydrogenase [Actinomadura rupiterrae]
MAIAQAPTRAELVRAAASLKPQLTQHAAWHEQNRRLHEDTVRALSEAGMFRLRLPARHGGLEADARTVVEVVAEIARADGSAAWVAAVNAITTWMAGLLPDEVQDEVFADPDARLCGTLSPTGMCEPADGGLLLNGRWGFISGAHHATWQVIVAMAPAPDGSLWPIMTVVPMSELSIVDDWDTTGLRGTGSVSTVAENVLVPQERVLPLPLVLTERYASKSNASSPVFRAPLLPTASALSVGAAVGLAAAARDAFFERLPGRKITYTGYERQQEAPVTHLRVAEAVMMIDEAAFHAHRLADMVDAKGADGSPWSMEERARARADMGRACRLAEEAAGVLNAASGGSSIYNDVPIQRIARDLHAINMHALMHPDTNDELYGRVLCGMEPDTLYI